MLKKLSFTKNFLIIFFKILAMITPIWGVILLVLLALIWVFARVEEVSFLTALYFGATTALTIGFGDITPITITGKVIAVIMGMLGVLNTGIIVAVALQAIRVTYEEVIEQAKKQLEQTKKK